ncbi:class II aldolase/adducin family protein [Pseudomonas sp. NPDC007930]|uniref:class II aldolase/adducin family protein n=1 Tax=Pseudomonas sp. NPDC007930 TaxID=3364417 RepID=UPI0036ECD353
MTAIPCNAGLLRHHPAPAHIGEAEWQARLDLAAAYRLGARFGWHDLLGTHFSARVPGTTDQFLVNPYGLLFEEITASSLVKIDLNGNVVDDNGFTVNPAADVIHGGIYAQRPDVQAILHLHSVAGVAVAAQEGGLLPISQNAMIIRGRVRYYPYTGVKLDREECARMASALGEQSILFLNNHGTLAAGRTLGEAFSFIVRVERACQIQIAAQSSGAALKSVEPQWVEQAAAFGQKLYSSDSWSPGATTEWNAFRRKIDRDDPGYAA